MDEVPPELRAVEGQTEGEFGIEGGRLFWCARWVGDALGDEPRDTTWSALCGASELVQQAGYKRYDLYNDHDTAFFWVRQADERAF